MFHLAAAGQAATRDFANKAAAVDGEMVDVINNMPLVRAFCGPRPEHDRFDAAVGRELTARDAACAISKNCGSPTPRSPSC